MSTFTPLPSKSPKLPKWGGLFSVAVVLMLLGGGILLVYAATKPKSTPASTTQIDSVYSTDAANTLAALQLASTLTPSLSTDTPIGSPVVTGFPQFNFTPPDTTATVLPIATQAPITNPVSSCNDSAYVSDVTIPDNTVMAPGASFVKTWALQNTGTCTWDTSFQLIFASGSQMGGASTKLTSSVAPSQQVQISVPLTAPNTAGSYTGYWRLADDQGSAFGESVTVVITVSSTLTSTPTGTLTTSTPTGTLATNTPTPVGQTPTPTTQPSTPTATTQPPTPTAT
ncbi:MAG: NBR1-Ig-like domain-containing protein [Anaerolineales bacterium]